MLLPQALEQKYGSVFCPSRCWLLSCEVDQRCAVMELEDGECITFKFGHEEACERFILCMRILIDQNRQCFNFDAVSKPSKPAKGSRSGSRSALGKKGKMDAKEQNATQAPRMFLACSWCCCRRCRSRQLNRGPQNRDR